MTTLRRIGTFFGIVAAASAVAVASLAGPDPVEQKDLVGQKAPEFTLVDTEGKEHNLAAYTQAGKVVVLEWFNPKCPYVVKHYEHNTTMNDLAKRYGERGVVWLAVNSGHEGNSTTGTEVNKAAQSEWEMNHPVLLDYTGKVGRSYGATNTPNMYVIDAEGTVRFAGAIDNNSDGRKAGDVNYVAQALDAVLAGETVATGYAKPYGCSVKYGKN